MPSPPLTHSRCPLWIKLAYTAFAIFFITVQLTETPLLLMYLCNAAIVITLIGLWLESRLLLSMQLLAVFWPQLIWQFDYVAKAVFDLKPFEGLGLTATDYMFDPAYPLIRRIASFQHAWLVWLLLWLVWRLGYDRRALRAQTVYTWALLLLTLLVIRDPYGPAGNVNYIFGPAASEPQFWVPWWAWFALLMVLVPLCMYAPLHVIFRHIPAPSREGAGGEHRPSPDATGPPDR